MGEKFKEAIVNNFLLNGKNFQGKIKGAEAEQRFGLLSSEKELIIEQLML